MCPKHVKLKNEPFYSFRFMSSAVDVSLPATPASLGTNSTDSHDYAQRNDIEAFRSYQNLGEINDDSAWYV